MLSIFPDLLTFWLAAPLVLRVSVGLIFVYFGAMKIWKERERRTSFFRDISFGTGILSFWFIAGIELVGGILLVLGLFTQIAALTLLPIAIGALYVKIRRPHLLDNTIEFYVLLIATLLALLVLGPGFFAIDLPL